MPITVPRILRLAVVGALAAFVVAGCAAEPDAGESKDPNQWPAITLDPAAKAPALLSKTGLARLVNGELQHNPALFLYELRMPLFSDHALKRRALWIPPGKSIEWGGEGPLRFPVGSIIVKSFLFAKDLRQPDKDVTAIETRVLVRDKEEWKAWPYVWNAATGEAELKVAGTVMDVSFTDAQGKARSSTYLVPQRNQCKDCHDRNEGSDKRTWIIGPRPRYLRLEAEFSGKKQDQLKALGERGWLQGLPDEATIKTSARWDELASKGVAALSKEEVTAAARDYLDINCAHCHSPTAVEGETSQLYLNHDNEDAFLLGVCKAPSSAGKGGFGRKYDIVPGKPDESILVYRLETTNIGAMMPDIGRSLVDELGVQLVRKWVEQMPTVPCNR